MSTMETKHISVSIERSASDVYTFASNPANLPQWATGLGGSIANIDGEWIADSPMGRIKIKFAERNAFGVLDHYVTLPSGGTSYNPMRVAPNGSGSEIIFTLFRQTDMTSAKFEEDANWVRQDLEKLKAVLEKKS